jgi:hypothetical protein
MAEKKIGGVAYLKADGLQYELGGSITVSPSQVEREGKVGLSGVAGYTEKPRIPFIEADVHTTSDLSAEDLEDITAATVTAELANGKVYVLQGAWCTSALEIDGAEGQLTVRFEGVSCEEI